ncbi:MAG: DUF2171 domain-containing protein [Thermomicrobiales bacterium]
MSQDATPDLDTTSTTDNDWTVREGTPVIAFDGEKIGEVDNATGGYLLVKKGFLFPKEYAIPADAIQNVGPDAVYLKVTREIAHTQGWDAPLTPEATEQPLPITPASEPLPQVVTGEPEVDTPLIGTFTDQRAGIYADVASGTEAVSNGSATIPATDARDHDEAQRAQDQAIRDTDLAGAGIGADAEEISANPIATSAVPAGRELPVSEFESDAQNVDDADLAGHDEVMEEGVDSTHLLRSPSPLPAMNVPFDDLAPGNGADGDIGNATAVENEAIDPDLSGNTPSEEDA